MYCAVMDIGCHEKKFNSFLLIISTSVQRLRPSLRRALGHEPTARYNDLPMNPSSPSSSPFRRSNSTPNPSQDLFSAPRHATATFRLIYTSTSCLSAFLLFHTAVWWPRHVFGSHPFASTKSCWDLSGSVVTLGFLDTDYDDKNGALKYFFLAQAAYQLHSLCFHMVSMLLLLLYGGGSGRTKDSATRVVASWFRKIWRRPQNQQQQRQQQQLESIRIISMKTSTQSYIRPMVEHVIVLALLMGAYLFSGLRRLGALGIFTLELSSVFLQLLQLCIYAPEKSWWRKPSVVIFVHRFLTIPTFM